MNRLETERHVSKYPACLPKQPDYALSLKFDDEYFTLTFDQYAVVNLFTYP